MKHLLLVFLLMFIFNQLYGQQRVLYGENAIENEFPWMATIYDAENSYHCGATLIADRWVITARHCLVTDEDLKVVINPYFQSNPKPYAEEYKVVEIHNAPGSEDPDDEAYKDIVLLKLEKPALVEPVKLANEDDIDFYLQDSFPAFVLGWGFVDTMYTLQDTLKLGKPVLFNQDSCEFLTKEWIYPIKDSEICAGYKAGTPIQGGAAGDSGGPLFIDKEGEYVQIGVVSRGNAAFTKLNEPGIYFHLATIRDWIDETIEEPVFIKNQENEKPFRVVVKNNVLEITKIDGFDMQGMFYLLDVLGTTQRTLSVNTNAQQYIDVQDFEAGIYFLVYENNKYRTAMKVVIR